MANRDQEINFVDAAIKNRRTVKVLAIGSCEKLLTDKEIDALDQQVIESVKVAGWAPFHYDRKIDGISEPWRFSIFHHRKCREISQQFFQWFDNVKPNNKLPKMLDACGSLVLVTWLPEADSENIKLRQVNEEHLAAASAATQNLILALEARGLGTYWSSGGQLGSDEFFTRFQMEPTGRLIAAVFVNYPNMLAPESIEIIGGKNREKRSTSAKWARVIE